MLLRGLAWRHRLVGVLISQLVERKATGLRDRDGTRDRIGKGREQPCHLGGRLEMSFGIGGEPEACFGDGAFLADAGDDIGERPALRRVIMDVVDRDERRAGTPAELIKKAEAAWLVAAIAMHAGEKCAVWC